ncbi:MAG: nucleotidyltransferase domain-containing protein [Prevotellaceae bacterium]|nr:nucleotidyltransferase domain-containing protein [Prevotellaceae bacterium]
MTDTLEIAMTDTRGMKKRQVEMHPNLCNLSTLHFFRIFVGKYGLFSVEMYLDSYKNRVAEYCRQNRVKSLYAFGSVLTSRFNENSDVDLVVDIDASDPLAYANSYFNLKFALQDLLQRPVDLLEDKAIRNPLMRERIDDSKQLIYAKQ